MSLWTTSSPPSTGSSCLSRATSGRWGQTNIVKLSYEQWTPQWRGVCGGTSLEATLGQAMVLSRASTQTCMLRWSPLWWRGWASSSPHAPSSTSTGGTWPLSQMEYWMIFSGTWEFLPNTLCTTLPFRVDPSPPWPLQPSSRNKLIHGVPGGEGLCQAAQILWPLGQAMVLSTIRLSRW